MERAGQQARLILAALDLVYREGAGCYFHVLISALDACAAVGHHLPRMQAVDAIQRTVEGLDDDRPDLGLALERYSAAIVSAAYRAPRMERGLSVMTAHQAKGKEFDALVLADASERFWPDNDQTRRLFYVAITRPTAGWTVVAPDRRASPLIHFLTGNTPRDFTAFRSE